MAAAPLPVGPDNENAQKTAMAMMAVSSRPIVTARVPLVAFAANKVAASQSRKVIVAASKAPSKGAKYRSAIASECETALGVPTINKDLPSETAPKRTGPGQKPPRSTSTKERMQRSPRCDTGSWRPSVVHSKKTRLLLPG